MAFGLFLIFLFGLLSIGATMKSLPKVGFALPFSSADERAVLHHLIDDVCAAMVGGPTNDVLVLSTLARGFVDHPSEVSLRRLLSFQPSAVNDQQSFYACQQIVAFFKKNASFNVGVDTEGAAIASFFQGERKCLETNTKLRSRDDSQYARRATLIYKMSRKISQILGSVPRLDTFDFAFGPGATVGVSNNTSVRFKLDAPVTTTVDALQLFERVRWTVHTAEPLTPDSSIPSEAERFAHLVKMWPGFAQLRLVRGSRFTTVSKTALTDRGINVEPTLNSYLQKGIGSYIRRQLKRCGIDLNDQTVNQRLARIGSKDGSLATIDLSMASDTIAYLLVMDLLPREWFDLLDACRSPVIEMPDGTSVIAEKFSAMGNGYTFELESLIFYAMLAVVCDEGDTISVYGDDLICPSNKFVEVIDAISLLGFVPNETKSFGTGKFRESCGKDYWDGTDVRPVFLKEKMSIKEIYRLHNFAKRTGRLTADSLLPFIPKSWRHFGPDGYGDGHLIGESPIFVDKRGWDPFLKFKTFAAQARRVQKELPSDFGAFMYHSRNSNDLMIETFMYNERSRAPKYTLRNIRVPVGTYRPLAKLFR